MMWTWSINLFRGTLLKITKIIHVLKWTKMLQKKLIPVTIRICSSNASGQPLLPLSCLSAVMTRRQLRSPTRRYRLVLCHHSADSEGGVDIAPLSG